MNHYFWDSNVLVAYLNQDGEGCDLPSLNKFVSEARAGECRLYTSSIVTAEILPSYLLEKRFKSFQDFVADIQGGLVQISPNPNILHLSARLRDIRYRLAANKKDVAERRLDVPDAIMLATAIVLREGYKQPLDAFHTFDNGGKRSIEGTRCVPILSFQGWCELLSPKDRAVAQRVIDLPRRRPVHPNPDLPGV